MDGFGITTEKKERKPIFKIYRFQVYDVGAYQLLEPSVRKRNINFQIESDENKYEKMVVRFFKNEENCFYKARMYFLPRMDREMCWLLANALIAKLKKSNSFCVDFELKVIEKR